MTNTLTQRRMILPVILFLALLLPLTLLPACIGAFAFMDTERVTSDKPVELTRGQDRFTANSMDFDNKDRVLLLTGRVRGQLVPAKTP